jgi:hypothetical protein
MQRFFRLFIVARYGLIGLPLALIASHPVSAQSVHLPPVVSIVSPTNEAVFNVPSDIELIAKATSPSGTISNVVFYAGNKLLGDGVLLILDPPGDNGVTGPVYVLDWTNAPPGSYALTAVATDNLGASTTSAPVNITVRLPGPLPVVRIISPPNHAVFYAPSDIPIFAFADAVYPGAVSGAFTTISNVEFFAGNIDLGSGHRVVVPPPGPLLPPVVLLPNEFTLVWSNPPPGAWPLTAVATDDHGMTATSSPVNITILPSHIITNGLDVVSIVATDPVAIEGTNCWVWPGLSNATPTWAAWQQPVWKPYTNCGPKEAAFTVRRAGNTSNDLAVAYAISGTASNGVDYVMLPGVVTIPAGKNYALINIVPLDDTPSPAAIQTVILTLQPNAKSPPSYIVGIPPRAGVIILDNGVPHPPTSVLPGSVFHLNAPGPDGAWFCIRYTTNMTDWFPLATNQVVNGCIDFVDLDASGDANRFYQAAPQMTAPLQ